MKRENVNVLICSGGKRADIIKEFKNVLGDRGKVLITDAGELNAGRTFADGFLKSPRLQNEAYLPFLKKAVQKNKIKLVFSVIDPELLLLAEYQKELEELGARVLISPLSSVKINGREKLSITNLRKFTYGERIAVCIFPIRFPVTEIFALILLCEIEKSSKTGIYNRYFPIFFIICLS